MTGMSCAEKRTTAEGFGVFFLSGALLLSAVLAALALLAYLLGAYCLAV